VSEAKTAIKGGRVKPSRDVLPRYPQGSMYTTRTLRRAKRSSGGSGERGKRKISVIHTAFIAGCDSKGWVW